MSVLTQPPAALMAWARSEIGDCATPVDVSHPRAGSRVWGLPRPDGTVRAYLKVSPRPVPYEREVFALRHAVPALGALRAPQLIASLPQDLALLLSPVDGRPLRQLTLRRAEEAAAHRQAGRLLALLHAAGEPTGPRRREAEDAVAVVADGAERHIAAAGERLGPAERDLVRTCAARLAHLPPLPMAFLHGDAWPRNLLWNGTTAAWIDFERARCGAAVQDFVLLACSVWPTRPDLRTALLTGYGRQLTPDEEIALMCLSAVDAAGCLAWGPDHDDPQVTARGRRTLDRMLREGHRRPRG
ncbi:phosphotransferase enzyme family protein [Streptomyces sp. VRA16 Mangrove soil]|uniref:phosphotransferase enzyme family protein n=1 Tax=Streptomyces sp. VRA16 Mangrove soil TaxID=2817434 RepID=UPI001A9FE4BF|nr:aminoglycoside phosphotransferase family protein [Streptomyces sp. VRA16 Mangrove soil]MBO1329896.1 aminoglycoside phosphotransferase family protein [Streptomyces sp. VRA16 Mangrove soil]